VTVAIDCACVFDKARHLIHYCGCAGPKTPRPYHEPVVGPLPVQTTWSCQCTDPWTGRRLLKNQRHRFAPECLDQDAVDAFIARTGCGKQVARYMLWLELHFSK
jgi:hypothetical protein